VVKFFAFSRAFYFWYLDAIFWNFKNMCIVVTTKITLLNIILAIKMFLNVTKILGAPRIFLTIYIVVWKSSAKAKYALFEYLSLVPFHVATPSISICVFVLFPRLFLFLTIFKTHNYYITTTHYYYYQMFLTPSVTAN